jgi:hypothetical protein
MTRIQAKNALTFWSDIHIRQDFPDAEKESVRK